MIILRALVATAAALFGRLSFCAKIGAIIGVLSGLIFGLMQAQNPSAIYSVQDLIVIGLALAIFAWLVVLLILGFWLRYSLATLAGAALINAILTAILTVLIADRLNQPELTWFVGLIIGILVGSVLCLFCGRWPYILGKRSHG